MLKQLSLATEIDFPHFQVSAPMETPTNTSILSECLSRSQDEDGQLETSPMLSLVNSDGIYPSRDSEVINDEACLDDTGTMDNDDETADEGCASGDLGQSETDDHEFEIPPKRLCSSLDSSPADESNKLSLEEQAQLPKSTNSSPSQSRRRSRTVMTPSQTRILLAVLDETYFPTNEQREQLSKILQIPQRTIQVWFQNQRQKAKQFGKTAGSPSSSAFPINFQAPIRSNSATSFRSPSTYNGSFPHPSNIAPPITSYSPSPPSGRRPMLLYGSSPMPPSNTDHIYYSDQYPIRKRTFPTPSPSSWKYSNSDLPGNLIYPKGQRSASLPIPPLYPSGKVSGYYPPLAASSSVKPGPESSPSVVLSNLLQSTTLVKHEEGTTSHPAVNQTPGSSTSNNRLSAEDAAKVLEKFKEEEDQLELPSLLLALRG